MVFYLNLKPFTNYPVRTNEMLKDKKIASFFCELKNIDSRGCPSIALKIIDGVISLEFYSSKMFKPSLDVLKNDIASIENYLEKMLTIVKKLDVI